MHRPTRRALVRATVAAALTTGVVLVGGSGADAAEPANQGCVGESLSALASNQLTPGGFGAAVVGFAQDPLSPPGLGDGIQAFAAGQVSDDVVPNTCNVD
jgi:hypothetical protein